MSHTQPQNSIIVDETTAGKRLDVALSLSLPALSRTHIHKQISGGLVLVNGVVKPPKFKLQLGQKIEWTDLQPRFSTMVPTPMELEILFEDSDLLVVNKPAGLVVHPGAGTANQPTLVSGLIFHAAEIGLLQGTGGSLTRPGIVHRLDKDTSGALVVAKKDAIHRALAKQFADKSNRRQYVALLDGHMKTECITRESILTRDLKSRTRFRSIEISGGQELPKDGRYAKSQFTRLEVYGDRLTLVAVTLETGRTHQIRIHARDLKLPVVGDRVYHHSTDALGKFDGKTRALIASVGRQMLHAELLGITHPTTGNYMEFRAPWPDDLNQLIERLRPFRTL